MLSRWPLHLGLLLLGVFLWLPPVAHAEPGSRRDILRKPVSFSEVEVPSKAGPPTKLALTVFETQDYEFHTPDVRGTKFTFQDEQNRHRVRRRLMLEVQDWYARHLSESTGTPLTPEFVESLTRDHSLFLGRNTIVVLSDPNDFSKILALLRLAKPSLSVPLLPVQTQFKDKLKPLPDDGYERVTSNRIKIYSYRNLEPYFIDIQNARVFAGDTIELKHYSAVPRGDIDLSAILFHAAQEQGALSVARFEEGQWLDLGTGPVLVTPKRFVAESDNPQVIRQLLSFGFTEHQTFPGAIHGDRDAKVLLGSVEAFAKGFYEWNAKRRNSWQLKDIVITPREDEAFLRALLPADACTPELFGSLAKLNKAAQQKLDDAIRAATGR